MSDNFQLDAEHPWPGLASYDEEACDWFHGRDEQIRELLALVRREPLSVLYGRSGLGKTSLIQAGLFPLLREEGYLPIRLHLRHEEEQPEFVSQISAAITTECGKHGVDAPPFSSDISLWEYFHRRDCDFWSRNNRLLTPVLVFDQFEEIFTLGRENPQRRQRCDKLLVQIGDLVENRRPAELAQLPEHARETNFDPHKPAPRILLAFREDYLADFDILHEHVRARTSNRLRLLPMDGQTAEDAIHKAGNALVSPEVAEQIVRFIDSREQPLNRLRIEPALLSLVCRELNEKRIARKADTIGADLIVDGSAREVIEAFYLNSFAEVDERVRHFVEDRLLTAGGFRDSCALDNALSVPGVTHSALQKLVGRRLLRREEQDGHVRLALVHDVLAGPAKASRQARREKEERRREFQLWRKRWLAFATWCVMGAMVGISWLLWNAVDARNAAEKSRREADEQRRIATRNLGLALAEKANLAFAENRNNEAQVYSAHALALLDPKWSSGDIERLRGKRIMQAGIPLITRLYQKTGIFRVAWSPDGKTLATLDNSNNPRPNPFSYESDTKFSITLWDAASAKPVATLRGHTGKINNIAWSPNGKWLASASSDGTIRLWDMAGSKPPVIFSMDSKQVTDLAWSPDSLRLASLHKNYWNGNWSPGSQEGRNHALIPEKKDKTLLEAILAANAATNVESKAGWNADIPIARDISTKSNKVGNNANNRFIAKAPEQNLTLLEAIIAAQNATAKSTICLWEVTTGRQYSTITDEDLATSSIAWSPDGSTLASSEYKRKGILLWDVTKDVPEAIRFIPQDGSNKVFWRPDSKAVASVSNSGTIHLLNVVNNVGPFSSRELFSFEGHSDGASSVVWLPNAGLLWSLTQRGEIRLLNFSNGKIEWILNKIAYHNPTLDVDGIAWSPGGKMLVTLGNNGVAYLWGMFDHGSNFSLTASEKDIIWSPDGRTLKATRNPTTSLPEMASGKPIDWLPGQVSNVALSPNGRIEAAAADDKIFLWDVANDKILSSLAVVPIPALPADILRNQPPLRKLSWSPDSRVLALEASQSSIWLWSPSKDKVVKLKGGDRRITAIAWSPDGRLLASIDAGGVARFWNEADGKVQAEIHFNYDEIPSSVSWSPDGRWLLWGGKGKWRKTPLEKSTFDVTDWAAQAAKDEVRYGLKLEGVSLVLTR